ncbi:dienelactone hydrolase family protein [Hyphobacterium sp. HN65]|uniref:Dienelactone hydrolase family protein n=1 Tax=Hyphobacterium lacteum TaxID=3116575 RepID=A0ABU7LRS8_9PROT|nr:dienelactone hydrolase family protein [Hyphobacterium sp. HN65]MEE2526623.1 dienelactone hydrolase family protein [Hyphobacterium sp. HN65]
MTSSTITIHSPDGEFTAYRAAPKSGKGPAIVVLQEIFGVNKVMRDICDDLADQGYVAICPDLFWRIEPNVDITDKSQAEWDKAFDLFGKFNIETGLKDIAETVDLARRDKDGTGKVGAIGYCLGGLLAYLTACRTDVEAAVGYYGVNIPKYLQESENIHGHLMLHVAGKDQFVDAAAQKVMHDGLDDNPHVTLHDYPAQDHAFARTGGDHFDPEAADLANTRTRAFLQAHIG